MNDYELVVNKKAIRFIEKLFLHYQIKMTHKAYKQLLYDEVAPRMDEEELLKNSFDAYKYLLSNINSFFSRRIISRYYYLLTGKVIDEHICLNLQTDYYSLKANELIQNAIDLVIKLEAYFSNEDEFIKKVIEYQMLNYFLVRLRYTPITFIEDLFVKYENAKRKYLDGNKEYLYNQILDMIANEKKQPANYYKKLKNLNLDSITEILKKDKEILEKLYKVKSIAIYGSFANGDYRIDSDIDLIVKFKENMSYSEKMERKSELEKYLYARFGRFCDIFEMTELLTESLIKEFANAFEVY